ncbi:MAG: hypothetical protein JSR47_04970 [Proteobacteria bacterium]|nr:hypothetical protein [Pseudomonadota bacterium]MBS0547095.1 hypothetical protein [Pseudomonadota bacterium]
MSVTTEAKGPDNDEKGIVCVIDLGEHSRRRVRRLRRGEGRLMEKVEDAVAALQGNGVLSENAQTVVIVVRQEPSIGGFFDRDDEDDDDDDDDDDD